MVLSSTGSGLATSTDAVNSPILLGTYIQGGINADTLQQQVISLDQWTGKKSSMVAMLMDFETSPTKFGAQLDLLWNAGYTPFINLKFGGVSQPTAYDIAVGAKDAAITAWAQAIAAWAVAGKWLYIAPLPEMNTTLVSYGRQPINFQFAYGRILNIFVQNGISDTEVRWVFAPNGWTQLVFENYYPGDDLVDVIGVSAFNQGYCRNSDDLWYWNPPTTTFGFYIKKLHAMAPSKPIFITRAASTSETSHDYSNPAAKNQWLQEAYNYLAVQHGVKAVLYYNVDYDIECDWPVYKYGSIAYDGYRLGVANPAYGYLSPIELAQTNLGISSIQGTNVLPNVTKGVTGSQADILLGMYTQEWTGQQRVMANEVGAVDNWSGKHLSIVGTFVDFTSNSAIEIELQLETIWEYGYTPFLNLGTHDTLFTARRIAQGEADGYLREVAKSFAIFAKGGKQSAYVAPLYEMNADWAPYAGDPVNYILAYKHIQQLFVEAGVPDESVEWVFAPNGSSIPGTPEMEAYYPGDAYVDFTGMTAYHFGYCTGIAPEWRGWVRPEDTFGYIYRLIALAPEKKIIIAQTGTSSITQTGPNDAAKNEWLYDMYTFLSGFEQLHGIIYYNRWDAECDWAYYNPNGKKYDGYIWGINNGPYGFFTPYTQAELFFAK